MSQDNKKSMVMYQGDGSNNVFAVPMTKGKYGTISVAFVRRGLDNYEYNPTTWTLNGGLFAWANASGNNFYTNTDIPAVGATVYNQYGVDTGYTVSAVNGTTITITDEGSSVLSRNSAGDVDENTLLTWTGDVLNVGDYIVIERTTVRKQPYEFPNNQKHIERSDDNLERQIQEVADAADRALKLDPTYSIDSGKMNPVDWLQTILRSRDLSVRELRFIGGQLCYSTVDPESAEAEKTWTPVPNAFGFTSLRYVEQEVDGIKYRWIEAQKDGAWFPVAESTDVKAQQALDNSETAVSTANDAKAVAQEALTNSETAVSTANDAKAVADGIDAKAQQALDNSETAVSTSNDAKAIAQNAATDAENAVQTATNATDIANAANATAESAKTTATNANTKADVAVSTANSALQKANTAMAQSSDALADAAVSLENSEQAVATANEAKNTADGIDGKATSALTNSEQAVATANEAKNTVDGIDAKINDVQGDVDTLNTKVPSNASASNKMATAAEISNLQTQITSNDKDIANLQSTKADKATTLAGYGITDAYTKTELSNELNTKQNTLTAGDGIIISGDTISVDDSNMLQNTATGTNGLTILGTPTDLGINIGSSSTVNAGVSIGRGASAEASAAIGDGADAVMLSVAIGSAAKASAGYNVAIGTNAQATVSGAIAIGASFLEGATASASNAIQIGIGENSTANTLQIGNYTLLDTSTGKIPTERLPDIDGLPDQTGNAGKFLTTDGTKASWGTIDIPSDMVDYVVESQEPTEANGYTWYRLYKSGWVEQGGKVGVLNNSNITVTLPVTMANNSYTVLATGQNIEAASNYAVVIKNPTTTTIVVSSLANYGAGATWQVSGMSAQGSN